MSEALNSIRRLLVTAATSWIPELGVCVNVTLTSENRDALIAALDAAISTLWQPIETAPQDGTRVLLFTTTEGDEHLTRYLENFCGHELPLETVQIGYWSKDLEEWDLTDRVGNPTHWMPMPVPPATGTAPAHRDEQPQDTTAIVPISPTPSHVGGGE